MTCNEQQSKLIYCKSCGELIGKFWKSISKDKTGLFQTDYYLENCPEFVLNSINFDELKYGTHFKCLSLYPQFQTN